MNRLTAWIAAIGVNPYWIAFNAHWGFAFALVTLLPSWWTVAAGVAIAGVKEFYFDARNEVPKQTALDNWSDFLGYCFGLGLASWHSGLFR